jgi:hypothetical protein
VARNAAGFGAEDLLLDAGVWHSHNFWVILIYVGNSENYTTGIGDCSGLLVASNEFLLSLVRSRRDVVVPGNV